MIKYSAQKQQPNSVRKFYFFCRSLCSCSYKVHKVIKLGYT